MSNDKDTTQDQVVLEPVKLDKLSFSPIENENPRDVEINLDKSVEVADDDKGTKKKRKKKAKKEPVVEQVSAPNQMMIGFYSNVKKKDVERFIRSRAESKMSLKSAWFNIVKYDDGFAWELHDGGSGKGALNSIIAKLEYEPQVVIRLSSETLKITRRTNHSGLVAFRIPDSEDMEASEGVNYADNMKPVLSSGLGLFITGMIFATLGILSVFLASLFKFVILNENEPYQHAKQVTDLPISQIDKLQEAARLPGIFIQSVNYQNGKWQINTGSEEPQSAAPEPSSPPTSGSQANGAGSSNLAVDATNEMVQLSRSINNSNINKVDRLPPEIEMQLGSGADRSTDSRAKR